MRAAVLLACLLALGGCRSTALKVRFVDDKVLQYDPRLYQDDAAVVLYRADKAALVLDQSGNTTEHLRHEVIAVQGEGGLDFAEVKVPVWGKQRLVAFKARVIARGGETRTLDTRHMLADTRGRGERDLNAWAFRFPGVSVGDTLEYAWLVESEGLWNHDDQDTLGPFPVRRYQFELTASKPLVLETISHNADSPIAVRTLPSGDHQLAFSHRNLAPRKKVEFAPHWTFTEPRWAWRVVAFQGQAVTYDWLREWKDVVEHNGRAFYVDGDLYEGFHLRLSQKGCPDVPCVVQRGLDQLREKATRHPERWDRREKLGPALASGTMSILERVLALRRMLESAGLEALVAYGTDKQSRQTARSFPAMADFNHPFVYLPAQTGLEAPLTVDLHCGFCRPGQLTLRHLDAPLFVFRTTGSLGEVETEGHWEVARGELAPTSRHEVRHVAKLKEDGTLEDVVTATVHGLLATGYADERARDPDAREKGERAGTRWLNPLARLQDVSWGPCEQNGSSCEWTTRVTLPQHAARDARGWVVPTSMLQLHHDTLFDAPERTTDVHFRWDDTTIDEVLELELPPGTRLATTPSTMKEAAPGLTAEVTLEATPSGARLRRTLTFRLGAYPKTDYQALRRVADAFKRGRRLVLSLETTGSAAQAGAAPAP